MQQSVDVVKDVAELLIDGPGFGATYRDWARRVVDVVRATPPPLDVDLARDALHKLILHACSYHLEAWAASERDEADATLIAYRDNCIQRIIAAALAPKADGHTLATGSST